MALPAIPSALRGVSQLRGPVFDPRTGTYVYPGFSGVGLSTTGTPPVTTTPVTPSPPPPPAQPTGPLGMIGGGTKSGLRGVQSERTSAGEGPREGTAQNQHPNDRVDLNGPMGDVLDAVGTVAPGPLGAVATAAKAGMAYNNARITRDELRAQGYQPGIPGPQMAGAVVGQVAPFGVAGNTYGAGDWRSVMDAADAAQRGYYDGTQTYQDPAAYKTSPMGPVPRAPTYTNRTAPLPGQQPPAPPGAPPTGIRSVQAGGGQKSVVDREGREVKDPSLRAMGMLGGTKVTGPRPTRPGTRDAGDRGHNGADSRGGEERGDVGDAAGSGGGTSGTRGGTGSYL